MALIIDPLSVATQGYLESPNTPNVEARRDALRIATLGWIILDFIGLPDPNQPSDAIIQNSCTGAFVVSVDSTFKTVVFCSEALIVEVEPGALIASHKTSFRVESLNTGAKLRPARAGAVIDDGPATGTIKSGKTGSSIEVSPTDAAVERGETTGTIEPREGDE